MLVVEGLVVEDEAVAGLCVVVLFTLGRVVVVGLVSVVAGRPAVVVFVVVVGLASGVAGLLTAVVVFTVEGVIPVLVGFLSGETGLSEGVVLIAGRGVTVLLVVPLPLVPVDAL